MNALDDVTKGCIQRIAREVEAERFRQEVLWGDEFDQKNTANDWAAYICHYLGLATYDGRDCEYSAEKFRKNMVKVAALAQGAIAVIDRHKKLAPRHYEGQPAAGAKSIDE